LPIKLQKSLRQREKGAENGSRESDRLYETRVPFSYDPGPIDTRFVPVFKKIEFLGCP